MARAKEFRLSASRLSGSDDLLAVCIPYWFRDVLLDATERFLWSRVWTNNEDSPHTLTEEEITRIEYAIHRLSLDDSCLEDFMPPITIDFAPIINVNTGGSSSGCSSPPPWDGQPGQCYPIQEPPDQGQLPTIPPLPPEDVPPEEWDSYRCKLANYGWEVVDAWLLRVSQASTYLGTLAFILFFLWSIIPAAIAAFVGGALLELAASIVAWSAYLEALDELFERIRQWWVDERESIVCRFYEATNAESLRDSIVGDMLDVVSLAMEDRPDWFTEMGNMIERTSRFLLPLRLFTLPWNLVPPVGYVGAIDCPCAPEEDEEWQEHPTYVWQPLTNALLDDFYTSMTTPGQQNVTSHVLTDDGRIVWSYTDAIRMDMFWSALAADVVAAVTDGVRVAGIAWDFYESNPDSGSPYWYETMPAAPLDVTITPDFPKKWWVYLNDAGDSDVDATLSAIADYSDDSSSMATMIQSAGEVQSGTSGARNGRCRVRFLVKVST